MKTRFPSAVGKPVANGLAAITILLLCFGFLTVLAGCSANRAVYSPDHSPLALRIRQGLARALRTDAMHCLWLRKHRSTSIPTEFHMTASSQPGRKPSAVKRVALALGLIAVGGCADSLVVDPLRPPPPELREPDHHRLPKGSGHWISAWRHSKSMAERGLSRTAGNRAIHRFRLHERTQRGPYGGALCIASGSGSTGIH